MEATVSCPYCGEENTIVVDESAGSEQHYIEDCQVCCKPWQVTVTSSGLGREMDIEVRSINE